MSFTDFVKKVRKGDIYTGGCVKAPKLMQELLALQEEVGELSQLFSKEILYSRKIDRFDVLSEMGDILHYLVAIGVAHDFTLEDIIEHNTYKIKKKWGITDG